MVVVEIPSASTYSNLYTLSEFAAGTSLILTNNTSTPAFIVQASVPPLASSDQYPLLPGQTVLVHANADPIWIRGGKGPFLVQTMLETITPFTGVDLPHDLYTSKNERFRRIQVDAAQTGNDEGREFRTFKRINIPNGTTEYFRFVSPINFILWDERIVLSDGWVDSTAYRIVDNVAGVWTDLPQIGRNISSDRPLPFYTPQAKLQTGGTFTFLAANEVGPPVIVRTSSATAQATSVPGGNSRERILAAGTYYLKMSAMGSSAAVGCYYLDWEERP